MASKQRIALDPSFNTCKRGLIVNPEASKATSDNGQVSFIIPEDGWLEGLDIHLALSCAVDYTSGTPTARTWNPVEYIKRIELTYGSTGKKIVMSGLAAYLRNILTSGAQPHLDSLTAAEAAVDGTYTASAHIYLPLAVPDCFPPEHGLLPGQYTKSIVLTIDFGDKDDLVAGTGVFASWANTGTVTLHRRMVYPNNGDRRGYGHYIREKASLSGIVAGDNRFKMTPKRMHRAMLILCKAGTYTELSDAVMVKLGVKLSSATEPYSITALGIRDQMIHKHNWPITLASTGIYYVDFCKENANKPGVLYAGLDGRSSAEITATLETLAPTNVAIEILSEYSEN